MKSSTGVLTVNLAAIQENWRRVNSLLGAPTTAAAVIKANAYGLGAHEVGPALYAAGCREFFVATFEEALAARSYLPDAAIIYVLGGAPAGREDNFIQSELIPVLFDLPSIERWRQACANQKSLRPCALKIDTGMTRLGLDIAEFQDLCNSPDGFSNLQISLVMSHLACADEAQHPQNLIQRREFESIVERAKKILPTTRFSLANSSGVFLGRQWHFDLVRTGAALYGINPLPGTSSPVQPVVNLSIPVLQVRTLKQSALIGYGATVQLASPSKLVVAAGGYADGLHRTLGPKGVAQLGGALLPVVGRISMDTTIFDATGLEVSPFSDDAMIEVCNDQLTVDALAERSQALGYEILTSLGSRYKRRYLPGSV
jgi:alanine racemase